MGVINGQAVDQAITNPAFLDANQDDTASGIITLANTAPASGATVNNTQAAINQLKDTTGATEVTPATGYAGAPASTVTPGDTHEEAIVSLALKFHPTTGHTHDGTAGNGPLISATSLTSVPLKGYFVQGATLVGASGLSTDVSAELSGKSVSSGPLVLGLPVVPPYNRVILRQGSGLKQGDEILDALGNQVYGRITYSTPVWTLTYYVDLGGIEAAYSLPAQDVAWYFQELYNPLSGAPTYSELAIIPSDNATADVIDATASQKGKVQLAASAPGAIASSGAIGTANATVANADHTHEGVHSVGIYSVPGTPPMGDVELEQGSNITMTYSSGRIRIASSSGGSGSLINSFQGTPTGTVDGVNANFTLSQAPQTDDALQVFVDGILRPKTTAWTTSGTTLTFTAGNIPLTGQSVYTFYAGDTVKSVQEVPSGTVDGVNTVFTLTSAPVNAMGLLVYKDGLEVDTSEYILSSSTITFGVAPPIGSLIYAFYLTAGAPVAMFTGATYYVEYVTLTGPQATAKQVTLTYSPLTPAHTLLDVIGGGPQYFSVDFTVSGAVLSWNGLGLDGILASGDQLRIVYLY